MKRLLLFLMLTISFSLCAFSQAPDPVPDILEVSYEQPVSIAQEAVVIAAKSFDGIFETFLALVAFIPIVVQFLRRFILPNSSGLTAQIFSWAIGIAITMVGWLLKLGFLDGISIWIAFLYGAGACLAANGIFDTGIITTIFGLFGKKVPVK